MLARRGVKLVQFLFVGQSQLDDLWAHAAHEVSADRSARVSSRIHPRPDLHSYVAEPGLAIERGHPAAEVRVGAVARERHGEDLAESIECGMWRIADRCLRVRLKASHPTSRPREPDHLPKHFRWLRHCDQQCSAVNQIERARFKVGVSRVAAYDLDVAQTPARDKFTGHRHVRRVGVKPDDPPARRHPLGQQIDDPARSAPDIDGAVPGAQTNPVKKHRAIGQELLSLTLQAGTLATAAAQRIDGVRVIDGRGGR